MRCLGVLAALCTAVVACSSHDQQPTCLASRTYTFALMGGTGNPAACDVYSGGTVAVSLAGLHYMATGAGSAGSAGIAITRPDGATEAWPDCQISGYSDCATLMVVCTQCTNVFDVYLDNDGISSDRQPYHDFAQFELDHGNECYGNYTVRLLDP
jgi:hypothetical protein